MKNKIWSVLGIIFIGVISCSAAKLLCYNAEAPSNSNKCNAGCLRNVNEGSNCTQTIGSTDKQGQNPADVYCLSCPGNTDGSCVEDGCYHVVYYTALSGQCAGWTCIGYTSTTEKQEVIKFMYNSNPCPS